MLAHLECNGLVGFSRKQEVLPLAVRGLNLGQEGQHCNLEKSGAGELESS